MKSFDDEQICYSNFQHEGKFLLEVLNGHELSLVSAQAAYKALDSLGVETYDWASLVERLQWFVLEKFRRSMDQQ